MSNLQRIGLYLADDKIVLVESSPKKLEKIYTSSIVSSMVSSQEVPFHSDITEEIHIVAAFQKLLRENKLESSQVCVSIPIKEVFLRSFVVPFMPNSELNNVVYYEAKKYVPFDLKLLDYVYQAIPFVVNKQKSLRIIFYAVRKQTIEKYDRILKQIGCKAVVYEPSLVSLAKQLLSKNQLRADQRTVVVYVHENHGQIIFYEKGISYFVREFPLTVIDAHDAKAVPDILRANLLREIRKSFGYYHRQFSTEKIKEVLILSAVSDKELADTLIEEFSVKVRRVETTVTSNLQTFVGMDVLCASGACLTKAPFGVETFNFLQAKTITQSSDSKKSLPPFILNLMSWELGDFLYAIQAAVVCALLLGGGFVFSRMKLQEMQKQGDSLTAHQGELANKTLEGIDAEISNNRTRLSDYKKTFKNNNHMASMLINLTKALPKGVWLENITIEYISDHVSIDLRGYVYLEDEGAQFKAVNEFISHLREGKYFSSINFKLNTMQKKQVSAHNVVSFSIGGS